MTERTQELRQNAADTSCDRDRRINEIRDARFIPEGVLIGEIRGIADAMNDELLRALVDRLAAEHRRYLPPLQLSSAIACTDFHELADAAERVMPHGWRDADNRARAGRLEDYLLDAADAREAKATVEAHRGLCPRGVGTALVAAPNRPPSRLNAAVIGGCRSAQN